MLYYCEECTTFHKTEQEALECQEKHKAEKAKREELVKEKNARLEDINALVEKLKKSVDEFYRDYGESLPIRVVYCYNPYYNPYRFLSDKRLFDFD